MIKTDKTTKMKITSLKAPVQFGIVIMAAIFFSSCQSKSSKIENLQSSNDSLKSMLYERDSLMNDMIETFNQIEQNLAFIKEQRNVIAINSNNPEVEPNKKEQIIQDVQDLANLLQESKIRLDKLNRQLKASGVKITSLEKQIASLNDSLLTRNNEVLNLAQELEKKNYEVTVLTEQLTAIETVKEQQDVVIKEQESAINDLNKGFYVMGSAKELKEKGVITKEGGVLGIGKTKNLSTQANTSYFTEFDIRQLSSIAIDAKEAKLITEHPAGSYEFVTEGEKVASLTIKDNAAFYKFSKYVVIETK
jgi:hypothetical protein